MAYDNDTIVRMVEQLQEQVSQLQNDSFTHKNDMFELKQSINLQIQALNQMMQTMQMLSNKLSDMEVRQAYTDDSIKELVDASNGIVHELNEIKQSLEAMKFYSFNQNF